LSGVVALGARRAAAAADAGLLDVAYDILDSPLGPLAVMVTPRGLVRLSYGDEAIEAKPAELADGVSPRSRGARDRTDAVRRQLDEYFEGDRRSFDVPIDWSLVRGFAGDVLRATARIPFVTVPSEL